MRRAIVVKGDPTDRWHKSNQPAWSPDGTLIAYRLPHADAKDTRRFPWRFDIPWVIHVARADGSGDVQVSDDSASLGVQELAWMN